MTLLATMAHVAPRVLAAQDTPRASAAGPGDGAALVLPAAGLPAAQQQLLERLRRRIEALDASLDGRLGVSVEDLASGARIDLRADDVFPAASSIKLAVLYELYRQAAEGSVDLAELTRPPAPRVAGDGVLHELGSELRLSWRDLAVLMVGLSDNEATNVLVRRLGRDAVNRRLDSLSLKQTRLRRLMMDLEAAQRGEENVSTPRELARLAAIVARGEGLPQPSARDLLAVASIPDPVSPFRRALPDGQLAISKRGSLEGVRCEAAWVDVAGRPYAAAVMTSFLRDDRDGEAAITEISKALIETFGRLGRATPLGRVVSP